MNAWTLERFESAAGAFNYTDKFTKHWAERTKHRAEVRLISRLLRRIPASDIAGFGLDLPCGQGRFFGLLSSVAPRVIEGDWSLNMLDAARRGISRCGAPATFIRASALALPFADGSIDLVFSVRLCHHLPQVEERLAYLREIMRVTGKWAIFTYLDAASLKNVLHRLKRRFCERRPKWTMTRSTVADVAREAGLCVRSSAPLSRLFSGQRYTLLQRRAETEAREIQARR